jgi:uncharacterized protein YecT (DUF1311 family)
MDNPVTTTIAALLICGTVSFPALADSCDKVEAEDRLIQCLGVENSRADALLNAEYNRLRGRLDSELKERLRDAQRAWIDFRDKDCEFEAGAARGGQAYQPLFLSCQTRKTQQRVQELKREKG